MRVNIGCGQNPTKGWRNFDNSLSLHLSKAHFLSKLLYKFKLISASQWNFIEFCRTNHIDYGDATKGLPLDNASIDVFYSSHMVEHLDQADAARVLNEARRVLCSGGIIRLALPDLRKFAEQYIKTRDADKFISNILMSSPVTRTMAQKLKFIIIGHRNHRWMYDGDSLCKLLTSYGFLNARVMAAGETKIKAPEGLDLWERADESVYVEAENP